MKAAARARPQRTECLTPEPAPRLEGIFANTDLELFEQIPNDCFPLGRIDGALVQPESEPRWAAHPLPRDRSDLIPAHMLSSVRRERFSAAAPAARSVKYRFARPPRCAVGADIAEAT